MSASVLLRLPVAASCERCLLDAAKCEASTAGIPEPGPACPLRVSRAQAVLTDISDYEGMGDLDAGTFQHLLEGFLESDDEGARRLQESRRLDREHFERVAEQNRRETEERVARFKKEGVRIG